MMDGELTDGAAAQLQPADLSDDSASQGPRLGGSAGLQTKRTHACTAAAGVSFDGDGIQQVGSHTTHNGPSIDTRQWFVFSGPPNPFSRLRDASSHDSVNAPEQTPSTLRDDSLWHALARMWTSHGGLLSLAAFCWVAGSLNVSVTVKLRSLAASASRS
ncbi:hypothetical protein A9K55_000278 [Cordyceps militaris]|uniref:Uncharacterized protein n=1 Tax=Cordyceps militaris TaxID=73501 RepID=A0A2H4SVG8_CORMI|nr:hypothetical protein A9K55_000278 [Cordyceps militaris]